MQSLKSNQKSSLKSFDPDFKNRVAKTPGGENVMNCILCGTCTAGCPVSQISKEYNPRKIMRMVLLGMKDEVLSRPDIWQCMQCHICVAHCPQDVRLADVIRALREIAVDDGYVTQEFADKVEEIDLQSRKDRLKKINELCSK
jgi:heterodisulfide reductase subunit C2